MKTEEANRGVTVISAQLIAADEKEVTVEVYLDDETPPAFQKRIFDRKLLEGIIPIRCGALIIITVVEEIIEGESQLSYYFRNGEGLINPYVFYAESFTWERR